MIDDITRRRKLEVEIDQLLLSADTPEKEAVAQKAKSALVERKLDKAQKFLDEGKAQNEVIPLIQKLLDNKAISSKAEGRRLIEGGYVFVDERRAKHIDQDVKNAKSIRIKTTEIE